MTTYGAVNRWTWKMFYSEFRWWRQFAAWQAPGLLGPRILWDAALYAYTTKETA